MDTLNAGLQRLSHYAEGQPQEDAGALLFTSTPSPWAGFRLERHALSPNSERHLCWPTARIGLVRAGELRLRERPSKHVENLFLAGPDSITIWPAGYESTSFDWTGTAELVDLEIAPNILERFGKFDLRCVELAAQRAIQDRPLAGLVLAMEAEILSGCPSGRVYGESISIAVAAHIAARYAVSRQQPRALKGGLPSFRLSRLLDFVQANLDSNVGVVELAAIAHMSPNHFVQLFRQSMGVTPHQYVTRQRILEAKRLLAEGHLSIAEVALAVGFANQSHFGEAFRRSVGMTPKRYQEQLGRPIVRNIRRIR
jgi:AraC family transcriptional regulator